MWAYNNSAIQTLERVVAGTLGADVPAEAKRRLFAPLGMDHTEMTTDARGQATMYAGIRSTCRDMARFGSLFLARGDWNGTQARLAAVGAAGDRGTLHAAQRRLRTPLVAQPARAARRSARGDEPRRRGRHRTVAGAGLVPGAPADMFWALGLGNQVIQVDPGSRTVVVRLGTAESRPQPPTFGNAEASRVVTEAVRHTK